MSPLARAALRQALARPISSLLMLMGIALGVAGVVAMDIARTSVSKSFDLSTATLVSRATHQIMGTDFSIPQELFTRVRTEFGIQRSAPVITAHVKVPSLDNRVFSFMGIDPFSESHFHTRFTPDTLPGEDGQARGLFFPRSRGILISREQVPHLTPGDRLSLSLGKKKLDLPIAGWLKGPTPESHQALQGLILADIALAQEVLDMGNRISRIDLVLSQGEEQRIQALETALPKGSILVETRERNQSVRRLSTAFEGSLSAFSMLALFMGIFLIYNTVSFSVARQRKRNGTLRALGATRAEIFTSVMAEVMAFALVGSLLGLGLGILLGKGAVQAVCATVSEIYFTLTVTQTRIAPLTLFKGMGAGLLAAFVAALFPALSAARTRPITLIQTSSPEQVLGRILPVLFAWGLGLLCLTGMVLHFFRDRPGMDFVGIFMGFAGASLMVPSLIRWMVHGLILPLLSRLPGFGGRPRTTLVKMAAGNIARAMSRTGVLIASLMVVTSVYIGIELMTRSFRASVAQWVDGHIGGDIHINSADPRHPGLPRDLARNIRALPHVKALSDYTMLRLFSRSSGEVHLFAYETDRSEKQWTWTRPGASPPKMGDRPDKGDIWISEIFARRNQVDLEAAVPTARLETRAGPVDFPVAGVFRDYFMGGGRVVVHPTTLARHWGERPITAIQVFVPPGIPPAQLAATAGAVQDLLPREGLYKITLGKEMKTDIIAAFDRTFMITTALQFLTAMVALTGILNSVTAMVMERTREMGILRACGAQPLQVGGIILVECSLCGFLSGLLALPLGTALAWVLIQVVNYRSFGWTYAMDLAPGPLIQALALATLAAGAAGIFPALGAARTHIPTALHME